MFPAARELETTLQHKKENYKGWEAKYGFKQCDLCCSKFIVYLARHSCCHSTNHKPRSSLTVLSVVSRPGSSLKGYVILRLFSLYQNPNALPPTGVEFLD